MAVAVTTGFAPCAQAAAPKLRAGAMTVRVTPDPFHGAAGELAASWACP
jgi:hypothetical protein